MTSWPGLPQFGRGLFDDASMFPPEASFLSDAVQRYRNHRAGWYADLVGLLVCQATRLRTLDEYAERHGLERLHVAMVVPAGITEVSGALESARTLRHVDVRAIEVPLGARPLNEAVRLLAPLVRRDRAIYLETGASAVTESLVHRLAPTGLRLKVRAGGTSLDAFAAEADLARVLVLCAAERLALKCSAGLHRALRHHDCDTLVHHHGFLNIALAVRVATSTGSVASTGAVLGEVSPAAVTAQVRDLGPRDVAAIRAVLASIVTFNVADSVTDLIDLRLLARP